MVPIRTLTGILGLTLLLGSCGGQSAEPREPTDAATTATSSSTPVPLPAPVDTADLPGVLDITARPRPDWLTIANGVAWVSNVDHGIVRIRRDGHRLGLLRTKNDICEAMSQGFGSVWALDCISKQLIRMDLRTGALQRRISLTGITAAEDSSFAVGPEGVFVFDGVHAIARIDPETDRVDARRLPSPDFPGALTYGFGALWVTCPGTGVLSRLDPGTGEVLAEIPTQAGIRYLTTGAGAVWVLNLEEGDAYRIDPRTNKLVATIDVGSLVQGGDLEFGHGFIWARVTDAMVAQIDPRTNSVVKRYGPASGGGGVAADDTALWISAHERLTVWRIPLD